MLYKITHDQSTSSPQRLAVCSRNVAIYITRDYIVRQTKKLSFYRYLNVFKCSFIFIEKITSQFYCTVSLQLFFFFFHICSCYNVNHCLPHSNYNHLYQKCRIYPDSQIRDNQKHKIHISIPLKLSKSIKFSFMYKKLQISQ